MLDGEEWEMKFLVLFADFMSFFYINIYFFYALVFWPNIYLNS